MSNGRTWTESHTQTLERLNAIGCPDDLVAYVTGHCRETVQRQRSARQIPAAHNVRYAEWRDMPPKALQAILAEGKQHEMA